MSRDTAHAQPQNCHGPLSTAKRLSYDIASISETTTPIDKEFQDNYLHNENVSGDAVLWRHNKSKMVNGRHFEYR